MAYKTIAQREQERIEAMQQDPSNITLDWRAYFLDFMRVHGGDPVENEGLLLFQDGYRYSTSDYQGPEYRPPDEPHELYRLQVIYWAKRARMLRNEIARLIRVLENYHGMQQGLSARLHEQAIVRDEDGRASLVSQPFDVDKYRGRILACKRAEVEARLRLKLLRESQQPIQNEGSTTIAPQPAKVRR